MSYENKWERLSPEEQNGHIKRMAEVHDVKSKLLQDIIPHVEAIYYSEQGYGSELRAPDTLNELSVPLGRVLKLLRDETNFDHLCNFRGTEQGVKRLLNLSNQLVELEYEARSAHIPRGRGQSRSQHHGLYAAVRELASYWQKLGRKPTQVWHGKDDATGEPVPISAFAGFCFDIVKVVDPLALKKLPTVVQNVISELKH